MTQYKVNNVLISCEYYFDSDTSTSLRSSNSSTCFHLNRSFFFTKRISSQINYLKNSFKCFNIDSHFTKYDGSCLTCNLPEIVELSKILNSSFLAANDLDLTLASQNFSLKDFEEKYNKANALIEDLQDASNAIDENVINTIFDNKFYQYHLFKKLFSTLSFGIFPAYSSSVTENILYDLSLVKEDLLYLDKYL